MKLYLFFDTQIVPCNVRLGFNDITGDTIQFKADGGPYTFQVHKGSTKTKMGGEDWRRFISDSHVSKGDLIVRMKSWKTKWKMPSMADPLYSMMMRRTTSMMHFIHVKKSSGCHS